MCLWMMMGDFMSDLLITINGANQTPTWDSLQSVIRETLNTTGRLTRISRDDGGSYYRGKGSYTLTFTPGRGDETHIHLIVS